MAITSNFRKEPRVAGLSESEGLRFLLSGQEHLGQFEIRRDRAVPGDFVPAEDVVGVMGSVYRYFSPLARMRGSSTKDAVALWGNNVWLDADSPTTLDEIRRFVASGIAPSVVLASGDGFWCFWKLDGLITTDEIELLNQRVIVAATPWLSDVDVGAWNKNRCARLPGTLHEDTSVVAHFVPGLCPLNRHEVEELRARLPELAVQVFLPEPREISPIAEEAVRSVFNRFRWYIEAPPSEEELGQRGQSRHGIEFALVKALLREGCPRDEVLALADEWRLLKHEESKREAPGNPYGYINLTISNAQEAIASEPPMVRSESTLAPTPSREWNPVDRGEVLVMIAEAEREGQYLNVKGWTERIVERYGCTIKTAENTLDQLEGENDKHRMIEKVRRSGVAGKTVLVTSIGHAFLEQKGLQRGLHLLPPIHKTNGRPRKRLLRRPHRSTTHQEAQKDRSLKPPTPLHDTSDAFQSTTPDRIYSLFHAYRAQHFGFDSNHIWHGSADATAKDIQRALERNWIDDTYRLSFLGRQSSWLLQFPQKLFYRSILFHHQLYLGHAPYRCLHGGITAMPVYRSFVSQSEPKLENTGYDLIRMRQWAGRDGEMTTVWPSKYTIGVGLMMTDPDTPASYRIARRNGAEETHMMTGVIVEKDRATKYGPVTFWEALDRCIARDGIDDVTRHVFEVTRTGASKSHRFKLQVAGDAAPVVIPAEDAIDLDQVMNDLASEERLQASIGGLGERHCLWR